MAARATIEQKFAPLWTIAFVNKDLHYAIATAKENQIDLPLISATQKIYATAIEQGYGEDNITAIAKIDR